MPVASFLSPPDAPVAGGIITEMQTPRSAGAVPARRGPGRDSRSGRGPTG